MTVARDYIVRLITDPLEIVRCKSPGQKPFVRIILNTGEVIELSFSLEAMIHNEVAIFESVSRLKDSPVVPMINKRKKL